MAGTKTQNGGIDLLVTSGLRNFITWNFESVANGSDFGNLHSDVLAVLLQQSDLVVYNEMILFNYVIKWLNVQEERLMEANSNEADVEHQLASLVNEVMSNIRFPMMDKEQLATVLLFPLVMKHKDFFMEKMRLGVAFQEGQDTDQIRELLSTENDKLMFTPRLYVSENWSSNLEINNFSNLPSYHPRALVCSSSTLRESSCEQDCEWVIDFYPKGLCFQKCFLIVWQGTVSIPEVVIRTVRMSITCCNPPAQGSYMVKIGILVSGVTCDVENVVEVAYCVHTFSQDDNIFNINDLLSYHKLNDHFNKLCPPVGEGISEASYLIGAERDTLKLKIVIIPLCRQLSHIEEPYNSSFKYWSC